MPARLIIAAAAVGLLVFAGAVAVDAGVQESGERYAFSEGFNVSDGAVATLNESNRDPVRYYRGGDVTVENATGKLMFEGQDYDWIQDNGTVRVTSSRLADQDASIEYGYVVASQNLQNASGVAGSNFRAGTLLIWVVTVAFIVGGARALGAI